MLAERRLEEEPDQHSLCSIPVEPPPQPPSGKSVLENIIWSLRNGEKSEKNPWGSASLEWQAPDLPPHHGNWGATLPEVHRWAYDYAVPGAKEDFIPQNHPVTDEERTAGDGGHNT